MRALNEALVHRKIEGRYVTLLLMLWHHHSRTFTLANAGGSPPMICRNREIMKVQVEGVPLGLLPDREYEERNFHAQPGDIVVLFSDGVSDHLSHAGEEYGRGRLAHVLRECCGCSTGEIVQKIFADLDAFNLDRFDDQTLIVMRVN
jgi:sigma-B regulation protein RsbU (phosphoserine phosphatase)